MMAIIVILKNLFQNIVMTNFKQVQMRYSISEIKSISNDFFTETF